MGMTFKENVADIRNSKVVDIINELRDFGADVDIVDPYADPEDVKRMLGTPQRRHRGRQGTLP